MSAGDEASGKSWSDGRRFFHRQACLGKGRLSLAQKLEIVERATAAYDSPEYRTKAQLARMFGKSQSAISKILQPENVSKLQSAANLGMDQNMKRLRQTSKMLDKLQHSQKGAARSARRSDSTDVACRTASWAGGGPQDGSEPRGWSGPVPGFDQSTRDSLSNAEYVSSADRGGGTKDQPGWFNPPQPGTQGCAGAGSRADIQHARTLMLNVKCLFQTPAAAGSLVREDCAYTKAICLAADCLSHV